jgi:DNA-binding transcriptional MerR regulator
LGINRNEFVKNRYNIIKTSTKCRKQTEVKKMNTTHKKLVGGLLIGLLLATIGAAFATGQNDGTTDNQISGMPSDTPPQNPFGERPGMMGLGPFASELTDKQQTELEELMTTLREQNATPDEMRAAIQEKLDEFGVLDKNLHEEIARTEQRLTILNRQKELRNEGYNWDDIQNIIEDEFGLENATGIGWDMMSGHGCGHGPRGSPREMTPLEESDQ